MGDPVLFRDSKKEWKHGTALIKFGKTLYLKFGNWQRRVPIDTVMPDPTGDEKIEESFVEDRFKEEEVPVVEFEKDLEKSALIEKFDSLLEQLKQERITNENLSNNKTQIQHKKENLLNENKTRFETIKEI